jgi:hypothetical protein
VLIAAEMLASDREHVSGVKPAMVDSAMGQSGHSLSSRRWGKFSSISGRDRFPVQIGHFRNFREKVPIYWEKRQILTDTPSELYCQRLSVAIRSKI